MLFDVGLCSYLILAEIDVDLDIFFNDHYTFIKILSQCEDFYDRPSGSYTQKKNKKNRST